MMRKFLAVFMIMAGLALLSVPFYYHFYGNHKTNEMIEQFEQTIGKEGGEDEKTQKEEPGDFKTPISEEDAALLSSEGVIGLLEIEALDIKYPIIEGADSAQLSFGIGHITGTGAIGQPGNCVLAGHRGSRYGTYFKYLNRLSAGDEIKLMDRDGSVYLYEAVSWEVVGPYENSVKAQGTATELTLLTCENSGTMRLIYHCVLKEAE